MSRKKDILIERRLYRPFAKRIIILGKTDFEVELSSLFKKGKIKLEYYQYKPEFTEEIRCETWFGTISLTLFVISSIIIGFYNMPKDFIIQSWILSASMFFALLSLVFLFKRFEKNVYVNLFHKKYNKISIKKTIKSYEFINELKTRIINANKEMSL